MLDALCKELAQLACELKQAPREYAAVLLLGEVAAFLSDWHAPSRAVARLFADMAHRWAEELEEERMQEAGNDEAAFELQAKLCLLRATSLVCYRTGTLDDSDVRKMVCLMVQIWQGQVKLLEKQSLAVHLLPYLSACLSIRLCLDMVCECMWV